MSPLNKAKKFISANSWYTIGSNITNVLNYANTILIGRILGPSGVGDISSFGAYLAIFSIPISIIGTFVTQTASVDKYAQAAKSLIKKNIPTYIVLFFLIIFVSFFLRNQISKMTHLSEVSSMLLLPDLFLALTIIPLSAIALGAEKYKANALITLFGAAIKLTAVPILLLTHIFSSDIAIITITAGQVFAALALYMYLIGKDTTDSNPPTWKRVVSFAWEKHFIYTVLGSASMILLANIDIILARRIFEAKTAGIYATWSLLSKVVFFTLGPLLTVSFVKQSKESNTGSKKLHSSVQILIIFCILTIIPIYLGYQYVAPYILKIFFGTKFDALYEYLGLSGVFGTLTLLLNHLANTHIAQKSWQNIWIVVCVLGLVVYCYSVFPTLSTFYVAINVTAFIAAAVLYITLHFRKT